MKKSDWGSYDYFLRGKSADEFIVKCLDVYGPDFGDSTFHSGYYDENGFSYLYYGNVNHENNQ